MNNLLKRIAYWDQSESRGPYVTHDLEDSLPYPFEDAGLRDIFVCQNVLELGPGNGRQYEKIRPLCASYSIADISPIALRADVFRGVSHKLLITDWRELFGVSFNVIHFWYVLHHIQRGELIDFFQFIANHLEYGGSVLFNTPQLENVQGSLDGDGIGTTWIDVELVEASLPDMLTLVSATHLDKKSTGAVVLLGKY